MNFNPNAIHRIFLWVDVPLVYLGYTFVISMMELLAAFSISSWYFTRKKKEATLPTTMVMKEALLNHLGTICKLTMLKWGFK